MRIVPALEEMKVRIAKYEEGLTTVSDQNQCKGLLMAVKTSLKTALHRT